MRLLIQGKFLCPRFPFAKRCWPCYLIYDPVVEAAKRCKRKMMRGEEGGGGGGGTEGLRESSTKILKKNVSYSLIIKSKYVVALPRQSMPERDILKDPFK